MAASMGGEEMNSQQSGKGNNQSSGQDDPSTTLGIGGRTSGEAGATPTHETMAETGGSGGAGLTANQSGQSQASAGAAGGRQGEGTEENDSAMKSGARGFQDTRSRQAGGSATGLGTPETGANQSPADLERQRGQED
jgi:hypothetical protein